MIDGPVRHRRSPRLVVELRAQTVRNVSLKAIKSTQEDLLNT